MAKAEKKELGVAVVGSGRIGTLRANMASRHPSVQFLAVSDIDAEKAGLLASARASLTTLALASRRRHTPRTV